MLRRLLDEWGTAADGGSANDVLIRDEAVIALAFAQIMLDGRTALELAELAREAIERQPTLAETSHNAAERTTRLRQLRQVLSPKKRNVGSAIASRR